MQYPALPAHAMLTLNRCNLPAVVLGSVAFQLAPQPLWLDGVMELHRAFFQSLHAFDKAESRASCFRDYMSSCFLLDHLDQAGLNHQGNVCRPKADFLRTLRGWMFDADSQEAAVLKGWAESRFGLLPRYHQGPLGDYHSESWLRFQALRARGLYNTNALEAQLDVLYAWCQYELKRRFPGQSHSPQQPASCDAKSPTGAVYIFACVARTAAASPNVEKLMNRCGAVTRWWNVSSASPPRTSSTPGAPASAPKPAGEPSLKTQIFAVASRRRIDSARHT